MEAAVKKINNKCTDRANININYTMEKKKIVFMLINVFF